MEEIRFSFKYHYYTKSDVITGVFVGSDVQYERFVRAKWFEGFYVVICDVKSRPLSKLRPRLNFRLECVWGATCCAPFLLVEQKKLHSRVNVKKEDFFSDVLRT